MHDPRATTYVPEGGLTLHTPEDAALAREVVPRHVHRTMPYGRAALFAYGLGGGHDPEEVCRRFYLAYLAHVPGARDDLQKNWNTRRYFERLTADTPAGRRHRRILLYPFRHPDATAARTREVLSAIAHRLGAIPAPTWADPGLGVLRPEDTRKTLELAAGARPADPSQAVPRFHLLCWAADPALHGALTISDLAGIMWQTKQAADARAGRLLKDVLGVHVPGMLSPDVCARLSHVQKTLQKTASSRLGGRRTERRSATAE